MDLVWMFTALLVGLAGASQAPAQQRPATAFPTCTQQTCPEDKTWLLQVQLETSSTEHRSNKTATASVLHSAIDHKAHQLGNASIQHPTILKNVSLTSWGEIPDDDRFETLAHAFARNSAETLPNPHWIELPSWMFHLLQCFWFVVKCLAVLSTGYLFVLPFRQPLNVADPKGQAGKKAAPPSMCTETLQAAAAAIECPCEALCLSTDTSVQVEGPPGEAIQATLQFEALPDIMPTGEADAMLSPDGGRLPLSRSAVRRFVAEDFDLLAWVPAGSRVAVALPNGLDCALATLACVASSACVPLNPDGSQQETQTALERFGCVALLCQESGAPSAAAKACGVMRLCLEPRPGDHMGLPRLYSPDRLCHTPNPGNDEKLACSKQIEQSRSFTGRNDTALMIMTSGTTGKVKAVKHTLENVVVGGVCIARAWRLSSSDLGLNMVPLFHIGGIARSLFGGLLSGGRVLYAPGFDASLFWDLVQRHSVTWYYGSPTVHEAILRAGDQQTENVETRLRFVANAAGHLPNDLAERMADGFKCTILPCYGCSEAMPISSPPVDYTLSRPGSSGLLCGPQLCIMDSDGNLQEPGQIGNIVVRGCPCMEGYEGGGALTDTTIADWWCTGDTGYLDPEGWLFIVGRTKEVINRGGEIVAPAEVEEALVGCPGVHEAAAFSMPHDLLAETVGLLMVPSQRRPSLRSISEYLAPRLNPSKIPQIVVFVDSLPRGKTGKVLRGQFAQRCGLPPLTDATPAQARHWEATVPAPGVPLAEPIDCRLAEVDLEKVQKLGLATGFCKEMHTGWQEARGMRVLAARVRFTANASQDEATGFSHQAAESLLDSLVANIELHDYEVPTLVVPLDEQDGNRGMARQHWRGERFVAPKNEEERTVALVLQEQLEQGQLSEELWLSVEADFFAAGGTSLQVGAAVAKLRAKLCPSLAVQDLLYHRTARAIAEHAQKLSKNDGPKKVVTQVVSKAATLRLPGMAGTMVQMLPKLLVKPLKTVFSVTLFMLYKVYLHPYFRAHRTDPKHVQIWVQAFHLMLTVKLWLLTMHIIMPICGICAKWILIGRYKEGTHAMWGGMYVRWWLVDTLLEMCGRGPFKDFLPLYYWLLGAKIGRGVSIENSAIIGEFDLLTFGDGAIVGPKATVRGFRVGCSQMVLQSIRVGKEAEVCVGSIVVPGHDVPDGCHIGPQSSSYDMVQGPPAHKYGAILDPHWFLKYAVGYPLGFAQTVLMHMPTVMLLIVLSKGHWGATTLAGVWLEFATPKRILILTLAKICGSTLTPILSLAVAISVKRLVLGRYVSGKQTQWAIFRSWLLHWMVNGGTLVQEVSSLFGSHFQATSWIYRALGAKIGERIYWPGTGIACYEFDLLEIGDDVVFGSRSRIICCSDGTYKPVKIGAGAMLADHCLLLPGCSLGRNCMLGSGTIGPEDWTFAPGSTWVGSQHGRPLQLPPVAGSQQLKPFGRAFHRREANYFVWPLSFHMLFNFCWAPLADSGERQIYLLLLLAVARTGRFVPAEHFLSYLFFIAVSVHVLHAAAWMGFDLATEQLIIGTRRPGRYNWDESSYCQRWLLRRTLQRSARGLISSMRGTPLLCSWFRACGAQIGRGVCLYPTGTDLLMTEPGLVSIGEGACIDKCSLVAHSNANGNMELRRMGVGSMVVARSGTRLMSGASMSDESELLEHTLVLPGDVVPSGEIWRGWPAHSRQSDATGIGKQ